MNETTKRKSLIQGIENAYGYEPIASIGNICVFQFGSRHYVVEVGDWQVKSVGGDNPERGRWAASEVNEASIKHVANGRSRRAAIAMMRRACADDATA